MIDLSKKNIVIIEGNDQSGKSELANYLKEQVNGKCHIIHSNYSKAYPGSNNYNQHELIAKFARDQFSKKYYTGNRLVIFDRTYISDIVYGQIGYGSKGSLKEKTLKLNNLFNILTDTYVNNVDISVIYCRPNNTNFIREKREELLTNSEFNKIQIIYDVVFNDIIEDCCRDKFINFYKFDYTVDPSYSKIIKRKEIINEAYN